MMRIRIVGQAGESVFPFGIRGPWMKFKENLIKDTDILVKQKFGQKIDVLICHGYSKNAILEAVKSKIPKNKMVLVLWEPPITNPNLHSDRYLSNFGHIYAPSKEWAKKYNAIYFNWPIGKVKSKFKVNNFECGLFPECMLINAHTSNGISGGPVWKTDDLGNQILVGMVTFVVSV